MSLAPRAGSPTATADRSAVGPSGDDPFDTAGLRRTVLDGWAASPARFREDANAEEDASLGPYRDRLLVELLQNAADAATADGSKGCVLVRLQGGEDGTPELLVANTGAPLTAAGVEALSTLRASAKRGGGTVGRFGVGFAAVVSASDAPSMTSRTSGGVRWSRAEATAAVAAEPRLREELARRSDQVPLLRLPFVNPAPPPVPAGYETVVRLPLATSGTGLTVDAARSLLSGLDPTLLLVLPGLAEVVVDDRLGGRSRTHTCRWDGPHAVLDGIRWTGAVAAGVLDPTLLADRPVEERERASWSIHVLVPDGGWPDGVPLVLRAPQPTDEPLALPALVSVPVPLDPGRRRVHDGPLARWLLDRAADVVVDLAERTGDLALVPTALPAGWVDAALGDRLRDVLPDARVLEAAHDDAAQDDRAQADGGQDDRAQGERGHRRLRGRDALVLDLGDAGGLTTEQVTALLASTFPDLLPAGLAAPRHASALRVLGARRLGLGALVELVAGLDRPPSWWARLLAALAQVPERTPERDALAALPVPLVDGRTVQGVRGVLLTTPALAGALADEQGRELLDLAALRVVHPDVSSDAGSSGLLRRLGAIDASPRELLDAVVPLLAGPEVDDVPARPVLALVASADLLPGELPGLGELLLPDDGGELVPAQELVLPGSALAQVLDADAPFGVLDAGVAAAWPQPVLAAVGVLATLAVLRAEGGVVLDPDEPTLLDLHESDRWLREADVPGVVESLVAVRDLELVRWPDALALLAAPGPVRDAVLADDPAGYTRWWLTAHPVLGDLLPGETAVAGSPLAALYDEVPEDVARLADPALLRALGVRDDVAAVLSDVDATLDLLDRLAEPERAVPWALARALYVRAARVLDGDAGVGELEPPLLVRTPTGVVPVGDAVVVDRPDLAPLIGRRTALRVPVADAPAVARVLGVPLASALGTCTVVSTDPLRVRDMDGNETAVAWFGEHVDPAAGPAARARATAWLQGRWADRYAIAARLTLDEVGLAAFDAEDDLDRLHDLDGLDAT